jgi:outer membrane protein TolC
LFNQNGAGIAAAEAESQRQQALLLAHRTEIERDVRLLSAERDRRARIADHYAQTIVPVLREHRQLVERALSGMELDLTALLSAEDMVTQSGIEYLEGRLAERQAEIALARALGRYGKGAPGEPR